MIFIINFKNFHMKLLSIVLGLISVALAATDYQTDGFSVDEVDNQLYYFPCPGGKYGLNAVSGTCRWYYKPAKKYVGKPFKCLILCKYQGHAYMKKCPKLKAALGRVCK